MPTYICRSVLLPGIVRSALVMEDLLAALISLMARLRDPLQEILVHLLQRHGPLVSRRIALSRCRI